VTGPQPNPESGAPHEQGAGAPNTGPAGTRTFAASWWLPAGALVLLVLLAVAARAVTPKLDRADASGPLSGHGTLVGLLLGLVLLVTAIWFGRRWLSKRQAIGHRDGTAWTRFDSGLFTVLALAVVGLPLLLMLASRPGGGPSQQQVRPVTERPLPQPTPHVTPPTSAPAKPVHGGAGLPLEIIGIVLVTALLVAITVLLVRAWPSLRVILRRGAAPVVQGTALEDDEALAVAVDAAQEVLLDIADPRAAVIACYAAMEQSLRGAGVPRLPADSPEELLERASASGLIGSPAAGRLTDLFLEARFSTHPFHETHRERAVTALAEIRRDLDEVSRRAESEWAANVAAAPAGGKP
jgi:hypothetical protein